MKTFKHLVNGLVLVAVLAGNAIAGTPDELRAIVAKVEKGQNLLVGDRKQLVDHKAVLVFVNKKTGYILVSDRQAAIDALNAEITRLEAAAPSASAEIAFGADTVDFSSSSENQGAIQDIIIEDNQDLHAGSAAQPMPTASNPVAQELVVSKEPVAQLQEQAVPLSDWDFVQRAGNVDLLKELNNQSNLVDLPEEEEAGFDKICLGFNKISLQEEARRNEEAERQEELRREQVRLQQEEEAERKAREEAERKAREEAARKEAARKAKEKEEADRKEAARLAKEKEEAERKAKEEARKEAAAIKIQSFYRMHIAKKQLEQKKEAARKAREEAERKAREEAERKAREEAARKEAARKAKEKEEAARKEAARLAKEKEEAERKAKEEARKEAAAIKIQSFYRMHIAKKQLAELRLKKAEFDAQVQQALRNNRNELWFNGIRYALHAVPVIGQAGLITYQVFVSGGTLSLEYLFNPQYFAADALVLVTASAIIEGVVHGAQAVKAVTNRIFGQRNSSQDTGADVLLGKRKHDDSAHVGSNKRVKNSEGTMLVGGNSSSNYFTDNQDNSTKAPKQSYFDKLCSVVSLDKLQDALTNIFGDTDGDMVFDDHQDPSKVEEEEEEEEEEE